MMDFSPAAIAYFAFNRPEHTRLTLAALTKNKIAAHSKIYIFLDHPRNAREKAQTDMVREIASAFIGFKEKLIICQSENLGLYRSITQGVSNVLEDNDSVIVIEDDILVSQHFLDYMNQALQRYRSNPVVGCIHAYSPDIPELPDFYFLQGGDCWGWATWSDRWQLFCPSAYVLLEKLVRSKSLTRFCISHGYSSLLQLVKRARNKSQSWAILWHASLYVANRYTLHAGRSFVRNIGNDGSGTNATHSNLHDTAVVNHFQCLPVLDVRPDPASAHKLGRFLDSQGKSGFKAELVRFFLRIYALSIAWLTYVTRSMQIKSSQ